MALEDPTGTAQSPANTSTGLLSLLPISIFLPPYFLPWVPEVWHVPSAVCHTPLLILQPVCAQPMPRCLPYSGLGEKERKRNTSVQFQHPHTSSYQSNHKARVPMDLSLKIGHSVSQLLSSQIKNNNTTAACLFYYRLPKKPPLSIFAKLLQVKDSGDQLWPAIQVATSLHQLII